MTGSAGFAEMVRRFDVAAGAAVDRARRASGDAAERAEAFRAETSRTRPGTGRNLPTAAANQTGGASRSGDHRAAAGTPGTPDDADDAATRAAAVEYRRSKGLPVEVFAEHDEPRPAPRQERKSSVKQTWPDQPPHEPERLGHDDDDFSQGSIFS